MNEELDEMLETWQWDAKTIEFMRNHPDLRRLKDRRNQIYEETKCMSSEEKQEYFKEAVPNNGYKK